MWIWSAFEDEASAAAVDVEERKVREKSSGFEVEKENNDGITDIHLYSFYQID